MVVWKRGYPEIIGRHGKFTKSKDFSTQADTKKAVNRAMVRYFLQELMKKGAIKTEDLPSRFAKWLDTASSECIFNEYQHRTFSRAHLIQCPWYLELKPWEPCADNEKELKARCDRETQDMIV